MPDITVTNTIKLPGGGAPLKGSCLIELVTGTATGGFLTGIEVVGAQSADVTAGVWSKTLTPNIGTDAITDPATTYYRITETADGMTSIYYIQVDGAGAATKTADQIRYTP